LISAEGRALGPMLLGLALKATLVLPVTPLGLADNAGKLLKRIDLEGASAAPLKRCRSSRSRLPRNHPNIIAAPSAATSCVIAGAVCNSHGESQRLTITPQTRAQSPPPKLAGRFITTKPARFSCSTMRSATTVASTLAD
jgi:hypothetical protein